MQWKSFLQIDVLASELVFLCFITSKLMLFVSTLVFCLCQHAIFKQSDLPKMDENKSNKVIGGFIGCRRVSLGWSWVLTLLPCRWQQHVWLSNLPRLRLRKVHRPRVRVRSQSSSGVHIHYLCRNSVHNVKDS